MKETLKKVVKKVSEFMSEATVIISTNDEGHIRAAASYKKTNVTVAKDGSNSGISMHHNVTGVSNCEK